MLSYYFPPLGMGGTQRAMKMVRYLPAHGWEATVITVKPIAYWAQDPSLLDEIPSARIIRTGSLDPQRLLKLARPAENVITTAASGKKNSLFNWINRRVLPFFLLPDSKILWHGHACAAAARLLRHEEFAAVYSTSPPHSVHVTARRLARKFNLPWVADFRDAWAGSVVVHEPTRLHHALQQRWQKKIIQSADAVIAVTPGSLKTLQGNDPSNKYHFIPNGFDADDFPPPPAARKNGFQICHCGSITTFSNPRPVLEAFARLQKSDPAAAEGLTLRFVGYDTFSAFPEWVAALQLQTKVTCSGYVTHQQALAELQAADALLLIACHEQAADFIPGKTYEYLGSRKPILLVSNIPDTLALLKEMPGVLICHPHDPAGISAALLQLKTDARLRDAAKHRPLQPYERNYQAGQLAQILNTLTLRR